MNKLKQKYNIGPCNKCETPLSDTDVYCSACGALQQMAEGEKAMIITLIKRYPDSPWAGFGSVFDQTRHANAGSKTNHLDIAAGLNKTIAIAKSSNNAGSLSEQTISVPGPEEKNTNPAGRLVVAGNCIEAGKDIRIKKGKNVIGRSSKSNIILSDRTVSRQHAALWYDDGRFVLVDLNSTNGLIVNGTRIYHPTELAPGDVICIGAVSLQFLQSLPHIHEENTSNRTSPVSPVAAHRVAALPPPEARTARPPPHNLRIVHSRA